MAAGRRPEGIAQGWATRSAAAGQVERRLVATVGHLSELTAAAARLCRAPLSLVTVSAVAPDAEQGVPVVSPEGAVAPGAREDLARSFGQLVVDTGELVRIRDAAADERVRASPAVTQWSARACLGAPLRWVDGEVVGALCVVDHQPRDWSSDDEVALAALASAASHRLWLRAAAEEVDVLRAEVQERARRLDSVLTSAPVILGTVLPDTTVAFVEGRTEEYLGRSAADLVGRRCREVFVPEVAADVERALRGVTVRAVREIGSRWFDSSHRPVVVDGQVVRVDVVSFDVTDQQQHLRSIERLAYHDTLTGLLNRVGAERELRRLLDTPGRRDRARAGYLLVDVDNFAAVNASRGRQAGDQLLAVVADRLRSWGGSGDGDVCMVARVGSDSFAVVLGPGRLDDPRQVLEEVPALLAEPIELDGYGEAYVTFGLGLAVAPQDGDTAALVMERAETALSQAKRRGRGRAVRWSPALSTPDDAGRAGRLRRAIESGVLEVHYQPVVLLGGGGLASVEALCRWTDDEYGPVTPTEFIDLAERTGLIRQLGEYVLDRALRDLAGLPADVVPRVSVNVSPLQLDAGDLVATVHRLLAESGVPADRLILEITESVMASQTPDVVGQLEALRADGVRIAIDDFGTGYSSMARLRFLPVDVLKIDRSFVRGLPRHADAQLLRGLVDIAQAVGLMTVVEGVETTEQEQAVRQSGAVAGQGWLYARAMPVEELCGWLGLVRRA